MIGEIVWAIRALPSTIPWWWVRTTARRTPPSKRYAAKMASTMEMSTTQRDLPPIQVALRSVMHSTCPHACSQTYCTKQKHEAGSDPFICSMSNQTTNPIRSKYALIFFIRSCCAQQYDSITLNSFASVYDGAIFGNPPWQVSLSKTLACWQTSRTLSVGQTSSSPWLQARSNAPEIHRCCLCTYHRHRYHNCRRRDSN